MALPSGYKRLKYITSTGNQFIDTGRVPTENTKIVMGFQLINPGTGNRCLFGVAGQFSFRWYGPNSVFRANGSNIVNFPSGISETDHHTVEKTATSCTIDGTATVTTAVGSPTLSLYVMAQHESTGATNYASGNVDIFQWYENGVLVSDYIPCTSPDGIAGMWDDVNSLFLGSSGGAAFVAGPDAMEPYDGHNTNIDNVAREIEGGTVLIGGVGREIESGMTLVGGVAREIELSGGIVVLTITKNASFDAKYAYISIDGFTDSSLRPETTVEVSAGTVVVCHMKAETTYVKSKVVVNGETVWETSAANTWETYSYEANKNATIAIGLYNITITEA